jgi:hypothetical protein
MHLQLGRSYVLSGERAKAKTAYEDFLALWKEADSDTLILQQARKNMPGCSKQRVPSFLERGFRPRREQPTPPIPTL